MGPKTNISNVLLGDADAALGSTSKGQVNLFNPHNNLINISVFLFGFLERLLYTKHCTKAW
jgi:hypothetical protein